MPTQKKTTKTTSTTSSTEKKPRQPSVLTLAEAAEYLGISEHDLTLSRYRGIEPGKLAFKKDGVLVWNRKDLTAAVKDEAGEEG